MPNAKLYDMTGAVVGEIELPETLFGFEPSEPSIHRAIVTHGAAMRQGTQSTKTRAEVSGGGIKPWRQKGTGRARQGSTRSPQWTHGGIALGPKPRSYRISLNKRVRRLALLSALSDKALSASVYVIDGLDMPQIKTAAFNGFLRALDAPEKVLVITPEPRRNVILSARNIPGARTTPADVLSVYDIVNARALIVDKAALARMEEVYGA